MQGHRTTIGSLSDFFNLEHESSSSNIANTWSDVSVNGDSENLLAPTISIDFMNDPLFNGRGYDLSNDNIFSVGQSSRSMEFPVNPDVDSGFLDHVNEDSPLVERPGSFKSIAANNQLQQSPNSYQPEPFAGSSGSRLILGGENEGGSRGPIDGRLLPCKRKSYEEHLGQSSRSSGYNQDAESSHYPGAYLGYSSATNGSFGISERAQPRLHLGARGASSLSSERLPRNIRSRVNASGQHSLGSSINSELVGSDLGLLLCQESSSSGMNSQAHPPEVHFPAFPLGVGEPQQYSVAGDGNSRETVNSNSRNTLENHPMSIPSGESRAHGQTRTSSAGSIRIPRSITRPPQTGTSSSIQPPISHRQMQYPRRLSEYVRRSLSAVISAPEGGPNNHSMLISGQLSPSQDMIISSRRGNASNHDRNLLPLRSSYWRDRQGEEGVPGIPHSVRGFAPAGEGRRRLASEIRGVLDMMRRGQALHLEEYMILDHSMLFGVADTHDRHRDMRLDVDNMTYEELLALEERIGNVSTGLSEETISMLLKQRKCVISLDAQSETEPCCICQEEYSDGEDLGSLECGHEFHIDCIKQWLMHKNLCPICKTTGLST
ncbi:hypothetical protein SAY86_028141 [Trapa natans]|uniref:RING-type E3 ubiquitin transferase n=1 Tax=Trapa natans TaxID=22666 RepID=A0AAN7RBY0_TRANT|nr:hypothetical protein SAY86_028141 [Trapa natans]